MKMICKEALEIFLSVSIRKVWEAYLVIFHICRIGPLLIYTTILTLLTLIHNFCVYISLLVRTCAIFGKIFIHLIVQNRGMSARSSGLISILSPILPSL